MSNKTRLNLLRWLLGNTLPLIANWLRQEAASQLLALARQGQDEATQILAEAALSPNPIVQQWIAQTLRANLHTICPDPVWKVWGRTQSPILAEVLRDGASPASTKSGVRLHVLSLLLLGQVPDLKNSERATRALLEGLQSNDPILRATARKALTRLQDPDCIRMVCEEARQSNNPILEQIIREGRMLPDQPLELHIWAALLNQQPASLTELGPEAIPLLLDALKTAKHSGTARVALLHLKNPQAVRVFCQHCLETRDPQLEAILMEAAYLPAQPPPLRLYCALKTGNRLAANDSPASVVPALLAALQDDDPTLRSAAEDTLLHLKRPEARNALCLAFLKENQTEAGKLAQRAGYRPIDPIDQAAFLLLTGQWEALVELDFDQRLGRAAYQAASPEFRQRMARAVQQSGHPELLSILTSFAAAEPERMSQQEAYILIESLRSAGDWPRLWQVAHQLPLIQAIQSVRILSAHGWQPADASEQALYARLCEQCQASPTELNVAALCEAFPPILPRAKVRVSGRINDISFAPNSPTLALASGAGRVVRWNFQHARIEQVQRNFGHSIYLLTHTNSGRLLCAEYETNTLYEVTQDPNQSPLPVLRNKSRLTSLIPLSEGTFFFSRRDSVVGVASLDDPNALRTNKCNFWWGRSACLAPDRQTVALLSKHILLLRLDNLQYQFLFNSMSKHSNIINSVARCGCFTAQGELLVGQTNGQIIEYPVLNNNPSLHRKLLLQYNERAEALTFLPNNNLLLCAWSDGHMQLLQWPQKTLFATLTSPTPSLISLQVSPDGDFLACGSLNTFWLWDLRSLTLPDMIEQPIANLTPKQLVTLSEVLPLLENHASPQTQAPFRFLHALLEERFHYEIGIEDLPNIQAGEFDIMLDEES
jgi:HEAT repeat protein